LIQNRGVIAVEIVERPPDGLRLRDFSAVAQRSRPFQGGIY
jgi:hypothetical protein